MTGACACLLLASCSTTPRWIAVAGEATGPVLLIDADLQRADTLPVRFAASPGMIEFLAVGGGGAALLVGNVGNLPSAGLSRIRVTDGQVIDRWRPGPTRFPSAWSLLPDARTVVTVTADADGQAEFWSAAAGRDWAAWHTPVCRGVPSGIAVFGNAERIYVGCRGRPGLVVEVDPRLRRVVRTVALDSAGCEPGTLTMSRTGGLLFLTCADTGRLLSLDRVTLEPLASIPIEPDVYALVGSPTRPEAVATFPNRNELAIIDLRDRRVRTRIATQGAPFGIAITGDGRWAYVAQETAEGSGLLIEVDIARGVVTETFPVPFRIRAVALWPGSSSPVMDWR